MIATTKNTLFHIYMEKFAMNDDAVIAYAEENNVENYRQLLKEFNAIRSASCDHIWEITKPDKHLAASEINSVVKSYSLENFSWFDDESFKALLNWIMYMCWHEGILKD